MEFKNSKTANRRRYKSRYHSPHNYKTQRSKSENRAAILVAIATFLVIASLVLVFTFGDSIYSFVNDIFHPAVATPDEPTAAVTEDPSAASAAPTQAQTDAPTEPSTQAPTAPPVQQSAEFDRLIAAAGLNAADLSGSQMIFVQSAGTAATVYTYQKDANGVWQEKYSPIAGFVGAGGVADFVGPESNATPSGTYRIEYAMGINSDPGTLLKYYPIVSGMRWITDPASINYNRWIDNKATNIDFTKSQQLDEYTISYPYAVVFDYNRTDVDSTQGCAKFLHVGKAPTKGGGIGIDETSLRSILLWLDPGETPMISIF